MLSFLKNYTRSFSLRFILFDEYRRLKCKNKKLAKQIWRYPGRAESIISFLHFFHPSDEVVLVDVGANVGNFALSFKEIFSNTEIIAFEPASDTFAILSKKFSDQPAVSLHHCAISNVAKMVPLYLQGTHSEQNSLEVHKKGDYGCYANTHEKKEYVQCATLDSFHIQKKHKKLCLKIDVEGHDIEVLEGATELLKQTDVMMIEANFINMNLGADGQRKAPSFSKICALCEQANLYPIAFHTFGDRISNYAFRRDVIFVKEKLLDNVLFENYARFTIV